MAVLGDRSIAGLLSGLAEAPDFRAAASFLLAQLADLAGARRAAMFRLDSSHENAVLIAAVGLEAEPGELAIPLSDLSSPLVISALALVRMHGTSSLGPRSLGGFERWIALPMSQPRYRGAPGAMSAERATELVSSRTISVLPTPDRRLGVAPAGVVLLESPVDATVIDEAGEILALASPLMGRLAALEEARDNTERLSQQRERLTLMVDSLPDPVVITNAANDIITQNHRAERLLHVRDDDSAGRRRAIELNNLLFTSFLSKAAMMGGAQGGPRELNLVDPDEGNDLLFEVLAHPLGERVGPEDAVLSVLRDVTDLRRAANELERQVQRVRQAEISVRGERDRLNLVL